MRQRAPLGSVRAAREGRGRRSASSGTGSGRPTGQVCTGSPGASARGTAVSWPPAPRPGVRPLLQRPVERRRLPGRPVGASPAAFLDDAEVQVPVGGLHAPRVQSRRGQRQQLVADESDRVDLGRPRRAGRAAATAAGRRCRAGRPPRSWPRPSRTAAGSTPAATPRRARARGRSRRPRWRSTSVTVGPAGSTRFSTRRCGTPSAMP